MSDGKIKPPKRIGMYGGAFDPPHTAHVALAQAAVEQLNLDVLHIIPTGFAWHKLCAVDPRTRWTLCVNCSWNTLMRSSIW